MNDPTDLTRRICKSLGENFLRGWEIPGPHSAKDTQMSGPGSPTTPDITLLPNSARYSDHGALLTWRIEDARGSIIFSVCLGAGWHRRNADFRLACYRSDPLGPADLPEWFERSPDDDCWRLRESALCRVPLVDGALL